MKNKIFYLTALVVCALGTTACARGKDGASSQTKVQAAVDKADVRQEDGRGESQREGEENGAADVLEQDGNLYVRDEKETKEYKAEDGTVLLTVETIFPVVDISGNVQAAAAINDYIRNNMLFDHMLGMSVEEALEGAKLDYKALGKDNWYGYALSVKYALERMDDKVISFTILAYFDMGGAHPNAVSAGVTFDTQTGNRLMIADVAESEEAAFAAVLEFLLMETQKAEYEGMFFEGYKENLGSLLTEDTWYLGEDGFHIIGNEYIIAPHAAGILDFVIPYEQAGFLKERYR